MFENGTINHPGLCQKDDPLLNIQKTGVNVKQRKQERVCCKYNGDFQNMKTSRPNNTLYYSIFDIFFSLNVPFFSDT